MDRLRPSRQERFKASYFFGLFLIGLGLLISLQDSAKAQDAQKGPSGLMVPRFQSLRADEVNVRRGPGKDHKILWVFRRMGMPVEIISEYKDWYEIRDSEGAKGWVHSRLLSQRKTVLISGGVSSPSRKDKKTKLLSAPSSLSKPVAFLSSGVVASLISCDENWCQISAKGYGGWIKRDHIWGIYPWHEVQHDDFAPQTTSTP